MRASHAAHAAPIAPAFAAPQVNPFDLFLNVGSYATSCSAPTLADLDGDGALDALIGAGDGTLRFRRAGGDTDQHTPYMAGGEKRCGVWYNRHIPRVLCRGRASRCRRLLVLSTSAWKSISSWKKSLRCVIDQKRIYIQHYQRKGSRLWLLHVLMDESETLALSTIGVAIPVSQLYQRVQWDEAE